MKEIHKPEGDKPVPTLEVGQDAGVLSLTVPALHITCGGLTMVLSEGSVSLEGLEIQVTPQAPTTESKLETEFICSPSTGVTVVNDGKVVETLYPALNPNWKR